MTDSVSDEPREVFGNGSAWLRADFHLHTKADKEFSFIGRDDYYNSDYVSAMEKAGIGIGLIANHNKFDKTEFESLRKTAKKRGIFLIPGVELAVNDGSNGIHVLIAFGPAWLSNGVDYVSSFLVSMFVGKAQGEYENENGRSDKNLLGLVDALDACDRDYFLVFAHVEQDKGLWAEMKGGKIGDVKGSTYGSLRAHTLAFQKVRTKSLRSKVQSWLGDWYPAEVEGSDCKSIEDIGKGETSFIKIGAQTFEAVKFALLAHQERVASLPPVVSHSCLKSVSFSGGILDGRTVRFSTGMNTLIGIRGSGKSSIIEAIRYTLDIPLGPKAEEDKYRLLMPNHTLGSGGKATVVARNRLGQRFEISRVLNEAPKVFVDGEYKPGVSITETILRYPTYFGQKDLVASGEGFEQALLEKIIGGRLRDPRSAIEEQRQRVVQALETFGKLGGIEEKVQEQERILQDTTFKLAVYTKNGIEAQLQKQVDYDTDERKMDSMVAELDGFLAAIREIPEEYRDLLLGNLSYESKADPDFFAAFAKEYASATEALGSLDSTAAMIEGAKVNLLKLREEFAGRKLALADDFAEKRRAIESELVSGGIAALDLEEFPRLKKTAEQAKTMLEALKNQGRKREGAAVVLAQELESLNSLWHAEFETIRQESETINRSQDALRIIPEYKADKTAFVEFFKSMFKGSRLRDQTYVELTAKYTDFIAMYQDYSTVLAFLGTSSGVFDEYFRSNIADLLTWQPPNTVRIEYHGKDLKNHSLGQRASALILFILGQKDSDVVIIDQPEDDLDNQTIYTDVIKLLRGMKSDVQFILATHNANIPVLGDAEQVIACSYESDRMDLDTGSIDDPAIQERIVSIMEGGREAFEQRRRIYEIWKPSNSSK